MEHKDIKPVELETPVYNSNIVNKFLTKKQEAAVLQMNKNLFVLAEETEALQEASAFRQR